MVKETAILVGPCYGELFWEFFRFAPYVFKNLQLDKISKVVVCTRRDRYDIYGNYADEFISLDIKMGNGFFPDCFRLTGFDEKMRDKFETELFDQVSEKYEIIKHIKPDCSTPNFCNKDQFTMEKRLFSYMPQQNNKNIIKKYLDGRPIIVLAPRYRANFKRNWTNWEELYDKIWVSPLYKKYQFIICGKTGEIVEDGGRISEAAGLISKINTM